jgi:DNA-binding NarL/FixJ family response regulator
LSGSLAGDFDHAAVKEKSMKRTRILLVDDHVMLLECLVSLLEKEFEVVGVARDGGGMLEQTARLQPDVVVLDIAMPELTGIEAARLLLKDAAPVKVLFMSMYADVSLVEEAFRTGASGYVLKSGGAEELVKAIHCISSGATYVSPLLGDMISTMLAANPQKNRAATLTGRQREVLRLLAQGSTMKEIGQVLNISTRTTESHKYEIMRNLGLRTTAELVRYAVRSRIV